MAKMHTKSKCLNAQVQSVSQVVHNFVALSEEYSFFNIIMGEFVNEI
jgi:hypothetical protein